MKRVVAISILMVLALGAAFAEFFLPDGMIGDSLVEAIGADLNGSIGTVPGSDSPGTARFEELLGGEAGPFVSESYDAAALILLAMQAANSPDRGTFKDHVMAVANAPGEQIFPGELAKGIGILAAGGDVDYVCGRPLRRLGPSRQRRQAPNDAEQSHRTVRQQTGQLRNHLHSHSRTLPRWARRLAGGGRLRCRTRGTSAQFARPSPT